MAQHEAIYAIRPARFVAAGLFFGQIPNGRNISSDGDERVGVAREDKTR